MRRSKTGHPWFIVTVRTTVDKSTFANALADHHWATGTEFDPKMSRRDAIQILETQLRLKGIEGIERSALEGADTYAATIVWLNKKYPFLNG